MAPPSRSFIRRVRRATITVGSRSVVLTTYHNIGMIDWAELFWGWLEAVGIPKFLLLELDGVTCEAARLLNCSLAFECATAADLGLPKEYTEIRKAGAVQEWGTDANSAYFKFLRWKLRMVEVVADQGVDVIMADADVLILTPQFITELAAAPYDLSISSDARQGIYDDNLHCPCSHPMYQRYSVDWVCAGLFYMRSTGPSLWFIREVQKLMDEFTITDQDAMQAVLTGHTQVAVPQVKRKDFANRTSSQNGYRPAGSWLKPLWLEGLSPEQSLTNMHGIQPLNTPMKEVMWMRYRDQMEKKRFTWQVLPLEKYGNGAMLVDSWKSTFSAHAIPGATPSLGGYLSIHANCFTKPWLVKESSARSFLLHPPGRAAKQFT